MVLRHNLAVLCYMFSVAPIVTDGLVQEDPLHSLQSSGFVPVGTPKIPCVCASVDNEETLHHRIVDACQTIRNYPGIFERMRRSMMRRVEACTESHGGYSEHSF
jgi:hypothetical protein